ncbi:MAG TPA: hypothetical protein VG345_13260 [Bryobacteraceae bacterium]|nr:hypothetical protein [Bryobacteraceae bacterium]
MQAAARQNAGMCIRFSTSGQRNYRFSLPERRPNTSVRLYRVEFDARVAIATPDAEARVLRVT